MDAGRIRRVGYVLAFGVVLAAGWPVVTHPGRPAVPTFLRPAGSDLPPGEPLRVDTELPSLVAHGAAQATAADEDAPYRDEKEALDIMRSTRGRELRAYLWPDRHKPFPPTRAIVAQLLVLMGRAPEEGLRLGLRLNLQTMPARFLPQIASLLSDGDAGVRSQGLRVLLAWRQDERTFALPSMAALVADPAPEIRTVEKVTYTSQRDDALLARLRSVFATGATDEDSRVRATAGSALRSVKALQVRL